jgi:hypothetical protein
MGQLPGPIGCLLMAKNSNKLAVLARRKNELDHALKHDFSSEAVAKRAEKVRSAAIAVIKKFRGDFADYEGGSDGWNELPQKWKQLTTSEIAAIVGKWRPNPGAREVRALNK